MRNTNARLESLERSTGERLEALRKAQVETEVRLATELVTLAAANRDIQQILKENTYTTRLAELEKRLAEIERKVG